MITGLGHAAFTTEDMDASLKFYCDVLGLKKAFELHNDRNEPWIVYLKIRDEQFLELFYGGQTKHTVAPREVGYNHLCLQVDDIHAIANHLKQKGIHLDVEPKQGIDLNYQCWAKDPDGNRIEFMQLHPDSPQKRA